MIKMNKKDLLIRIDERVKVLPEMKQDIKDVKEEQVKQIISLKNHSTRIFNLERAGVGFNIFNIIKRLLKL